MGCKPGTQPRQNINNKLINIVFLVEMAQQDQSSDAVLDTVLNADSVYSTAYSALCLCLQLGASDFYQTGDKSAITMTEVKVSLTATEIVMLKYQLGIILKNGDILSIGRHCHRV